jgi:hypothetical protein
MRSSTRACVRAVADLQVLQRAFAIGGVGQKDLVAHALIEVEQGQLGAGMRALAADDDPGAVGVAVRVDHAGQLGDLGAGAQGAVLLQRGVPDLIGQGADRAADRLGDGMSDREGYVDASGAQGPQVSQAVVRRHVAPGKAVPLHPEAVAFAGHHDFDVDVLAAYRRKGRVERQVTIVREHVLARRSFSSLLELDAAFAAWVPIRRARVHRTHGEVIGVRARRDHAALRPLPRQPYAVAD